MNKLQWILCGILMSLPVFAFANDLVLESRSSQVGLSNNQSRALNSIDIVVPLSQTVGTNNTDRRQPSSCRRCCIYSNESYSEGAVMIAADDIVLQCVRDKNVVGTQDLIWQRLKK